jgi:hypothetical protein
VTGGEPPDDATPGRLEAPGAGVDPMSPSPGTATATHEGVPRHAVSFRRAPRLRAAIAAFLVVAALLGATAATLALWTRDFVFDTDAYLTVVAPVAEDPGVRSSVAAYVAARTVHAVDLNDRFEAALPPTARIAAPALTRALRQFLQDEIEEFLSTGAARRLWVDINRVAHRQLITALRDQSRSVTSGGDEVTLDLVPLMAVALQRLEEEVPGLLGKDVTLPRIDPATSPTDIRTLLRDALGRRLPPDFATVTLVDGDKGHELKRALALFDDQVILVVVLTVVLVVAALLVSVHRRRTALWLGLGALLAFTLTRVLEVQLEKAAVGAVRSQGGAAVAGSVLRAAVSSLDAYLVWGVVAGAPVAAAALLARPGRLQDVGRVVPGLFEVASDLSTPDTRSGRWVHRHLDVLRVAGVIVAVVVLLVVTGSLAGATVVLVALVAYELALTAYAAGMPRAFEGEPDAVPDGRTRSRTEGMRPPD